MAKQTLRWRLAVVTIAVVAIILTIFALRRIAERSTWTYKIRKVVTELSKDKSPLVCGSSVSIPPPLAQTTSDGTAKVLCVDAHPVVLFYYSFGRGCNCSGAIWDRDQVLATKWMDDGPDACIELDNRLLQLMVRDDDIYYVGWDAD